MNEQEQNVVEYLTEHPDFFTTHPDLLAKLSVVHPQKGTLSLVEAQLEQQRQQIKTLTAFLEKFHHLAYQEADIFYAFLRSKWILQNHGLYAIRTGGQNRNRYASDFFDTFDVITASLR